MIVIYNRLIPFGGYQAMAIWPFIFSKSRLMSDRRKNHERIHLRQQFEVLAVAALVLAVLCLAVLSWWWMLAAPLVYYLLYLIEYGIRLLVHGKEEAYRNISFEREACANHGDMSYLATRKHYAWLHYIACP